MFLVFATHYDHYEILSLCASLPIAREHAAWFSRMNLLDELSFHDDVQDHTTYWQCNWYHVLPMPVNAKVLVHEEGLLYRWGYEEGSEEYEAIRKTFNIK